MGLWDKVKDFVGIEDNYYEEDEYYEDIDIDEDYFEENENDSSLEIKEDKPTRSYQAQQYRSEVSKPASYERKTSSSSNESRPSRSYGLSNSMQVTIREPLKYEDATKLIDDILEGKTVVLNLEMLEMDVKTQIYHFISGSLYAVDGTLSKVTKDIFVLGPKGIDVSGNITEAVKDKSLYQL